MKKFFAIILVFSSSVIGQNLHQRFDGMNVIINGLTCINPFNGGLEVPRYQFTDMDNDSDLDLFIYDKDTTLNFYRNEGTTTAPLFRLNTTRYQNLNIRNWFQFADLDGDGDKDIFCGGDSQRVRYYKNIGSAGNPNFSLQLYGVKTNLNAYINSESSCVPTLVDIDGDGDIDFLTGSSIGQITYYQNTGSSTNFVYTFITDFWKDISIQGGADDPRHGASAITFGDIDGDNDKDLYWGDLFGHSIYFIKNTGTSQNFQWNFIDTTSPEPNPYFSSGFNMPGVYDIDGDSKNDFFIGVLIGSKTLNNFVYFKNMGPVNNPVFTKITDNFILSADIGSYSYPVFADIDNDGDKDMFIGCDKSVGFYRNTGTSTAPAFTLVTDSLPLNINNFNFAPAIADLDGDGKKDMIVGFYAVAKLRYFKNTGTLVNPIFTYTPSQLDTMNLSQASAPCLADMDNDGDIDILAGNSSGRLTYYRNNGSPAVFNFQFITNNYMSVNVGNDAAPSLGDLDGDGDLDLLAGNRLGKIAFYRNTGSNTIPNFSLITTNYSGINTFQNSVPAIVDINNDSDPDLFLGNTKGGLYYYENWDVFGIQQIGNEIPDKFSLYQNYPNPFNPTTKIRFDITSNLKAGVKSRQGGTSSETSNAKIIIFDILGKEIAVLVNEQLKPGTYEVDFVASHLTSGVYFYRLSYDGFSAVKKMILVK